MTTETNAAMLSPIIMQSPNGSMASKTPSTNSDPSDLFEWNDISMEGTSPKGQVSTPSQSRSGPVWTGRFSPLTPFVAIGCDEASQRSPMLYAPFQRQRQRKPAVLERKMEHLPMQYDVDVDVDDDDDDDAVIENSANEHKDSGTTVDGDSKHGDGVGGDDVAVVVGDKPEKTVGVETATSKIPRSFPLAGREDVSVRNDAPPSKKSDRQSQQKGSIDTKKPAVRKQRKKAATRKKRGPAAVRNNSGGDTQRKRTKKVRRGSVDNVAEAKAVETAKNPTAASSPIDANADNAKKINAKATVKNPAPSFSPIIDVASDTDTDEFPNEPEFPKGQFEDAFIESNGDIFVDCQDALSIALRVVRCEGASVQVHITKYKVPKLSRRLAKGGTHNTARKYQRWSEEEDALLRKAIRECKEPPYRWDEIAHKYFYNTRSGTQCRGRWQKHIRPGLKRYPFKANEDHVILKNVQKGVMWRDIALLLPGRTGDQIRERFRTHLDPSLQKGPWTKDEVEILRTEQERIGNRWTEIACLLPGRSEPAVKNKWYNMVKSSAWQNKMGLLVCHEDDDESESKELDGTEKQGEKNSKKKKRKKRAPTSTAKTPAASNDKPAAACQAVRCAEPNRATDISLTH